MLNSNALHGFAHTHRADGKHMQGEEGSSHPSCIVESFRTRALSGRLEFTGRRHKFNQVSLSFSPCVVCLSPIRKVAAGFP